MSERGRPTSVVCAFVWRNIDDEDEEEMSSFVAQTSTLLYCMQLLRSNCYAIYRLRLKKMYREKTAISTECFFVEFSVISGIHVCYLQFAHVGLQKCHEILLN